MTSQISGLVVDDQLDCASEYKRQLEVHLDRAGVKVDWHDEDNVTAGREQLKTHEPYALAIIDLSFPTAGTRSTSDLLGLDLIEDVAAHSADTFILVITGEPRFLGEALARGAHHATSQEAFVTMDPEHSPRVIAGKIVQRCIDRGLISAGSVEYDKRDPAVLSLLETVGETNVLQLYQKVLQAEHYATEHIEVRALPQGASGAHICTVAAQVPELGVIRHVLKLSTGRQTLRAEAERGKRALDLLRSFVPVPIGPAYPVGPVNDWYALAGRLDTGSVTWRSWLAGGPPADQITGVLVALFVENLGRLYADGEYRHGGAMEQLRFTATRQRRVLDVLEEMEEVLVRDDGGAVGDGAADLVANLSAFVLDGRLPGVLTRDLPPESFVSYAHGDLHGGNLLVTTGAVAFPRLIDFADFDRVHWASDPAQFAVDVLMRSVDAGAESMFFTGVPAWRELVRRFAAGEPGLRSMTGTERTSPALVALSWMAENLPRFCPPLATAESRKRSRWEWHLALAAYLLRHAYNREVAPPKRAFALIAANDQLIAAAETLP